MQKWETYKDGEEYFLGNRETITVSTSKEGAQRIKDIVDGVYECSDWKCKHCGEKHVDERDMQTLWINKKNMLQMLLLR